MAALLSLLVQGCIYCFKLHIHVHLICLFCCFRLDWQKPDCVSFDCISMDPLLWFWNKNDIYCCVTIFITDPKSSLLKFSREKKYRILRFLVGILKALRTLKRILWDNQLSEQVSLNVKITCKRLQTNGGGPSCIVLQTCLSLPD